MEHFVTSDPRIRFCNVLGVTLASSADEIRNAYKKLAMRWHPDRWAKDPVLAEEAKKRFQTIQEAYEVLKSDQSKRKVDDLFSFESTNMNSNCEEGFGGFMKEMMGLMRKERRERKKYSMDELREMLHGIAHGMDGQDTFTSSMWSSPTTASFCGGSTSSPRPRGKNNKRSRSGVVEIDRTVDNDIRPATKCRV